MAVGVAVVASQSPGVSALRIDYVKSLSPLLRPPTAQRGIARDDSVAAARVHYVAPCRIVVPPGESYATPRTDSAYPRDYSGVLVSLVMLLFYCCISSMNFKITETV